MAEKVSFKRNGSVRVIAENVSLRRKTIFTSSILFFRIPDFAFSLGITINKEVGGNGCSMHLFYVIYIRVSMLSR